MTSRESTKESQPPTTPMHVAAPTPAVLPFDRVVIDDGGGTRDLTPEQFFSLPLAQRIQFVVEHRASFLSGEQRVDPKEALARIRQSRARH